jgi:hypothetical protein
MIWAGGGGPNGPTARIKICRTFRTPRADHPGQDARATWQRPRPTAYISAVGQFHLHRGNLTSTPSAAPNAAQASVNHEMPLFHGVSARQSGGDQPWSGEDDNLDQNLLGMISRGCHQALSASHEATPLTIVPQGPGKRPGLAGLRLWPIIPGWRCQPLQESHPHRIAGHD